MLHRCNNYINFSTAISNCHKKKSVKLFDVRLIKVSRSNHILNLFNSLHLSRNFYFIFTQKFAQYSWLPLPTPKNYLYPNDLWWKNGIYSFSNLFFIFIPINCLDLRSHISPLNTSTSKYETFLYWSKKKLKIKQNFEHAYVDRNRILCLSVCEIRFEFDYD